MGLIRILIICVICIFCGKQLIAQPITAGKVKIVELNSEEAFRKAKWNMRPPKRKSISYLYTKSSMHKMLGNPCAIKATRKMGFEYVLQPQGIPGSPRYFQWKMHNLGVNLKLIFTRSPFWRLTLKKKIRNCQTQSGDIVG